MTPSSAAAGTPAGGYTSRLSAHPAALTLTLVPSFHWRSVMKTNAVLLLVSFALVTASPTPARGADPVPPDDAKKVMTDLEKDLKAIEAKVRKEAMARFEKSLKQLQDLQDAYMKAAKKDDAAAVAGLIKHLKHSKANWLRLKAATKQICAMSIRAAYQL